MSASQLSRLQNLLAVILGGIETNNSKVSIQAIRQMEVELQNCAHNNGRWRIRRQFTNVKNAGCLWG